MYYCVDTGEFASTYEEYLKTKHWKILKERFLWKASCQYCGRRYSLLLHHITYDNIGNETQNDFTKVCFKCHDLIHKNIYPVKIDTGKKNRRKKYKYEYFNETNKVFKVRN